MSALCLLHLAPLLLAASPGAQQQVVKPFVHPGVLIDAAQLAFASQQVTAGVQPFAETFETLKKDTWITDRNASMSVGWNGSIGCGFFGHPDFGCRNETGDAQAALMDAMLWAYTKDAVWAQKAISIMDYYGKHMKQYQDWGNGKLQAAWSADKWARAAEIINSTGAGWPNESAKAFGDMLQSVAVPMLWNGSCYNGNWELSMIEGMMGIGVFTENRTLFDHSVEMWTARVRSYFYLSSVDGEGQPARMAACPKLGVKADGWNGQTVFSPKVDGVCAETCRDFGHTQFAVASTFNAAETALIQVREPPFLRDFVLKNEHLPRQARDKHRKTSPKDVFLQGVDLYATPGTAARLAATMEFHTGFLNAGVEKQGWPGADGSNPYRFKAKNITDENLCGG